MLKTLEVESEFTKHTEIIYKLIRIGKKLNYKNFVGKREQPESINNKKLKDHCDYTKLDFVGDATTRKRIEMIDLIWFKDNKFQVVIEVENSTNFTSSIQRASNLDKSVIKLMIIPDDREKEILNITDPLFVENFKEHNWKYMLYSDVDKILASNANMERINIFAKGLNK